VMSRPIALAFLLVFTCALQVSCSAGDADRPPAGPDHSALFDFVWSQTRDRYFDPDFNGVDWQSRRAHYRPLVARAGSEAECIGLLNRMLFELDSSHCGVDTLAGIQAKVSPYLFAEGTVGLDVRLLDNRIVIKEVVKGSSADRAGLKPGFVIESIDGRSLEDFNETVEVKPPRNERNRRFHLTSEILRALYGPAAATVHVRCLDGKDKPFSTTLERVARPNPVSLSPSIPPLHLEAESRMLGDRIGYLRFNAFQPEDLAAVLDRLDRVVDADGLIIDLRGNDGGSIEGMKRLLARFVVKRQPYGTYVSRTGRNPDHIDPAGPRFEGRVAVLVDEMSISGAENMPGIMQLLDLAEVIGGQTPGQLLCGEFSVYQERIGLVLPTAKLVYVDGRNPEGEGVIPDRPVRLNRRDLLNGVDTQLEAAVSYLSE
jgi:C-terminal processing protease CtpA/Prc